MLGMASMIVGVQAAWVNAPEEGGDFFLSVRAADYCCKTFGRDLAQPDRVVLGFYRRQGLSEDRFPTALQRMIQQKCDWFIPNHPMHMRFSIKRELLPSHVLCKAGLPVVDPDLSLKVVKHNAVDLLKYSIQNADQFNLKKEANLLHCAVKKGSLECVRLLCTCLAVDVNAPDGEGCTPLMLAVKSLDKQVQRGPVDTQKCILNMLVNHQGIDLQKKDQNGSTALRLTGTSVSYRILSVAVATATAPVAWS